MLSISIALYCVLLIGSGLLSVFLYTRFRKIFRLYCMPTLLISIAITFIGHMLRVDLFIYNWLSMSPSIINIQIHYFLAGFSFSPHTDIYLVIARIYLFMVTLASSYFLGLFIITMFDVEQTKTVVIDKESENKHAHPKGLFCTEDYWPYMFGIFVFAGFFAVPFIWGQFIYMPYFRLTIGSLIGCFVFAFAHTRTGQFSFGRFMGGLFLVALMVLKVSLNSGSFTGFIPGGIIGFLIMGGCGLLGIRLARLTGISKAFAK